MNNIAVCLSSDNNYVQHLGAAISSVLKNKNKDEFKFDLSKLNDNEYIDKVTKDSYELGINIKIIQPKELKLFDNILLSNISKYCPELKSI